MLILNYSHPLTDDQHNQIETLIKQPISEVRHIAVQLEQQAEFAPQIGKLIEATQLSATEWQTQPLLIVPPALNFIALALLAELHGLMGYFPDCVRMRPVGQARPPRFEVAEILSLQDYRTTGRSRR